MDKCHEPSIGILIPTWKGEKHLESCLLPLIQSPLKPHILVIDSSSPDSTADIARSFGVEVCSIPKREFNHGKTREWGRQKLATDIVVMMTQDAYPTSKEMLSDLIAPLVKDQASIAYARQIPHLNANILASFSRNFNYPTTSHIRSLKDLAHYGVYTFFCSNSCAAYNNHALDTVGGFPNICFGEDTVVTAKLLHNHHSIAYVAEAVVYHSHNYTLKEEFLRHLEIGFSRRIINPLIEIGGKDTKRGKAYTLALFQELLKNNKRWIPYTSLQILVKFFGYQIGRIYASQQRSEILK